MVSKNTTSRIFYLTGMLCLILASCASKNTASSGGMNSVGQNGASSQQEPGGQPQSSGDQNQAQQGAEPDIEAIGIAWMNSPHAGTYLVDTEGHNNNCAQCHAPLDWMPTMDTIPETCFTCKFELEDPPLFIPEEEWQDIPCNVCHELDRHDEVQAGYVWLAIAAIDEYEEVSSTTELCQKCHVAADPVEGHIVVTVSEVHQDQTCTDCHDAHNTSAECESCHAELEQTLVGHDLDHGEIACVLCHDGSKLAAGFNAENAEWFLVNSETDQAVPVRSSHNILLEAKCFRCHYANNPWQLSIQP